MECSLMEAQNGAVGGACALWENQNGIALVCQLLQLRDILLNSIGHR